MSNQPKVTVYDLDNKPHKMTHLNARDMIQHNGWTLTPVDRAALAKAQAEAAADDDDDVDTSKVDVSALEKELNGLSKAEMIAFAMETFGVKIDGRKAEAEVIETIFDLYRKDAAKPADEAADDGDQDAGEGNGDGEGDDE